MAENKLVYTIEGDDKPINKTIDGVGSKFGSMAKTIAVGAAAFFSFRAIQSGLNTAVSAANEAENAVRSFNFALASSGQFTEQASEKFRGFAEGLERVTNVSAETILNNSALLVSVGRLSGEGLERATNAALDLAKGLQIDVNTAFDIVTKAANGNIGMLARYGLEVNKNASDSEKFAAALGFIEQRFKGLSQIDMNTFQGASERASAAFGKIIEAIGLWITRSPKMIAFLNVMAQAFFGLADSINASKTSADVLIDAIFSIGKFVTDYILRPFEIVGNFLAVGLMQMMTSAIATLGLLAQGIDKAFGTDFATKIQETATTWHFATQSMTQDAISFTTTSSDAIGRFVDESKMKVDELASKMSVDLPMAVSSGLSVSQSNFGSFSEGFTESLKRMGGDFKQLGATISQTAVTGFSNSFASIGKALVQGENAFGSFGKAALSMIGNIAIQLGTFLILAGLGFSLIPGFQASAGAVAAGIGLTILGGALQALGGGGAAAAASAGSSAGIAGGADTVFTPSLMTEPTQEQEREKATTGVQIVVQGNILDRRETGLELVNILNENFDTNGTIVRGFA